MPTALSTLVPALPQSAVGFPKIPGVIYTGLKSSRYLLNYGPDFYRTGIMTINPPAITPPMFDNPKNGPNYPTYVPKTDEDGNDIAGIRLPDVTVPRRDLYRMVAAQRITPQWSGLPDARGRAHASSIEGTAAR